MHSFLALRDKMRAARISMKLIPLRRFAFLPLVLALCCAPSCRAQQQAHASDGDGVTLAELLNGIRGRAHALENSSGMRDAFQNFLAAHHLSPESVRYSDFVFIRLFFEATRDAGFWNLHWQITDQPPHSDRIWRQWASVRSAEPGRPTAIAECDELSALYAFLVERSGVRSVGLFWPYANHTVAVWTLKPVSGSPVRVVVPTSQIFLQETDSFDTRKFDPWKQKTIYEYTRRDVPDTFVLPKSLAAFFLRQIDTYGGASDATLQRLRYVRDAVFVGSWTSEQAAEDALRRRASLSPISREDSSALQSFAEDMRLQRYRQ
jgi:hypothetical protein